VPCSSFNVFLTQRLTNVIEPVGVLQREIRRPLFAEITKNRGLTSKGQILHRLRHSWIPTAVGIAQLAIKRLCPRLKQQMCSASGPAHLLFLHHALADHPVDGGFGECRRDPLSIAITLAIVGDERSIVFDVTDKVPDGPPKFVSDLIFLLKCLKAPLDKPQSSQRPKDIPVPEIPLNALQIVQNIFWALPVLVDSEI
jgi:hypothetical protein